MLTMLNLISYIVIVTYLLINASTSAGKLFLLNDAYVAEIRGFMTVVHCISADAAIFSQR